MTKNRKFCKIFIAAVFAAVYFQDILHSAGNDYKIVYKKQVGKTVAGHVKMKQICSTDVVVNQDGLLFGLEEYDDHFKVFKSDLYLKNRIEIKISRDVFETTKCSGYPRLIPCSDGGILLFSWIPDPDNSGAYRDDTDSEAHWFKIIVHLDHRLRFANRIKSSSMHLPLPILTEKCNFYYSIGERTKKTPRIINNYIQRYDTNGDDTKKIILNNTTTDAQLRAMLYIKNTDAYTLYDNNKCIVLSNYDLFNRDNFKMSFSDVIKKQEIKYGILYVLDPENGRLDKIVDLSDKINNAYKQINTYPIKRFVISYNIVYDKQSNYLVFVLWEHAFRSTCSKVLSKHLVSYNLQNKNFKMVKLGSEFTDASYVVGHFEGICYYFDWATSILYGLKIN